MSKFNRFDAVEMLGITPLCTITDEELWARVVTPVTKGLLGPIVRSDPPVLLETTAGGFPGDEVSNLNDHRLYGGQTGFVRMPYIKTFCKTKHGAFVVKRDGVKLEFFCWSGDVERDKAELILKIGARDRRFDGTPRARDTALVDYRYDDPILHRRFYPELRSVELSCYSFMPGSRIADATGEAEFESFVQNPFTFLNRPELFLTYFRRVWKSKRAPGQVGAAIIDASREMHMPMESLLKGRGYDLLEGAASHHNVLRWFMSIGYRLSDPEQARTVEQLFAGLEKIRRDGLPLTRQQQAWTCVIQNLRPAELIPPALNMFGPLWPQTNCDDVCLWIHKPVSEKARAILAQADKSI